MQTTTTPQVWIGCLAAYNEGHLHGQWTDATDADGIAEAGAQVIRSSPALLPEELFIADYNGFPGTAVSQLGEYPDYEQVAEIANAIEDHGEAFCAFLEIADSLDEIGEFEDRYQGEHDSEKAFAYELVDELGWGGCEQVPEDLAPYLDWDMIVRDLFRHGDFTAAHRDGRCFVFRDEA